MEKICPSGNPELCAMRNTGIFPSCPNPAQARKINRKIQAERTDKAMIFYRSGKNNDLRRKNNSLFLRRAC
jgi:hypothetical protein